MELRCYQIDAVDRCRAMIGSGIRRLILQCATGGGKTVVACHIIRACVAKSKRCLFLAPSRELVRQASDKLDRFGVKHGIIMAGHGYDLEHPVQVGTKDTLLSRAFKTYKRIEKMNADLDNADEQDVEKIQQTIERLKEMHIELPPFDLIVPDECHLSTAATWRFVLNLWPKAVVLGLTATPAGPGGKKMDGDYNGMVQTVPNSRLLADGWLVPTRVFAPMRQPNLRGLRPGENGEFPKQELEKRMNKPELVGDIIEHWTKFGEHRQTILFASGINHSMNLRDRFINIGVSAEHLDGSTPPDERDKILERFEAGVIKVLCNCSVLVAGWDCPAASCCIDAQPSRSLVRWLQKIGRIRRPFPGKKDALLLDHGGCTHWFGIMPDHDINWELKDDEKIQDKAKVGAQGIRHCPKCHAMFSGHGKCPSCGFEIPVKAKPVNQKSGSLVEITDSQEVKQAKENEQLTRTWNKCLAIAANTGGTCKKAAVLFIKETGKPPWECDGLPNMPSKLQFGSPVAELFPQYIRRKKVSA